MGRDVGDPARAVHVGGAGEAAGLDDAAHRIARGMAFGAMARAFDQIAAAIPLRVMRRIGGIFLVVHVEEFPTAQQATDVEGKADLVRLVGGGVVRQRLDVGEHVAHILHMHALVRGVGQRRIEMLAMDADAALHGVDELQLGPVADAVGLVGRNVGHMEGAEWRLQCHAAAQPQPLFLADGGVAAGAAAGVEHLLAILQVGRVVGGQRLRPDGLGSGDEPEDA